MIQIMLARMQRKLSVKMTVTVSALWTFPVLNVSQLTPLHCIHVAISRAFKVTYDVSAVICEC